MLILSCSSVSFNTTMKKKVKNITTELGTIALKVYTFKKDGKVDAGGEESEVFVGSVKVNIEIEGFQFCKNDSVISGCDDVSDC